MSESERLDGEKTTWGRSKVWQYSTSLPFFLLPAQFQQAPVEQIVRMVDREALAFASDTVGARDKRGVGARMCIEI